VDDGDATLVGRRAEAREVPDDAAADRHDVVAAAGALGGEPPPDALGGGERLVGLPRRHLDQPGEVPQAAGVQLRHGLVGDRKATGVRRQRPRGGAERAVPDPHRVVARGGRRPQQPQARRPRVTGARRERAQRAGGPARDRRPAGEQHGVSGVQVRAGALGVQRGEALGITRERPAAAPCPLPCGIEVDVDQHRDVAAQRGSDPLGAERAAAEGDHAAVGRLEQLAGQRLLARPERGLALAVEERLDRLAESLLEQPVGVERLGAERGRDLGGRGCLAGSHEADEDEGGLQRRPQPIRSQYASTATRTSSM
jgi:hypothetical protein